ncbi:membrane hypothetical protein [Candidatus Magnetomoraceae bacterium gMMP-1]
MIPFLINKRYTLAMIVVLMLASALRFYNLSFCNLLHDSSASLEASMSIAKNNFPLLPSDIWYARSPLYHYFVGFLLKLIPYFPPRVIGRFITALFSVICCFEIYILGKTLKNQRAGFIGALIAAISPFFIYMSRIIRFYPMATAFGLLTMICFYKGYIIEDNNKKYQVATFIFLIFTFLLGEVSATVIPSTALGYLLFGQKPDSKSLKTIILGTLCFFIVVVADMLFLYSKGRTPYIAMHFSTSPQIVPHLTNLFDNISIFFIGDYQINIFTSFLFIVGLIWAVIDKNKNFLLLFLIVIGSVWTVQFLVLLVSQRYFTHLFPLLYLAVGFSIERSLRFIFSYLKLLYPQKSIFRPIILITLIGLIIFALTIEGNPINLLRSYNINLILNTRSEDAIRFAKSHMLKDDVLITAFGEISTVYNIKVHYYPWRLCYFDEVFYKKGKIVERHSNGIIVGDIDKMRDILKRHKRVWVVYLLNTEFDNDMMQFIRLNFPIKALFGNVYVGLWDSKSGSYQQIKPLNNYNRCYF